MALSAVGSLLGAAGGVPIAPPFGQLNGYWGQYHEDRLRDQCDRGIDYVTLSFVNVSPENDPSGYPGTNFAGHCWAGTYTTPGGKQSKLLSECHYIKEDIPYCQKKGVKVLLSIGGDKDAGNYNVSTPGSGFQFARFLHHAFGPPKKGWTGPRPFDKSPTEQVSVDGFDFDIELDNYNADAYINMVKILRESNPKYYITAAPQCVTYSMEKIIKKAKFDALFVQFYNNPVCDAIPGNQAGENFNYDAWVDVLAQSEKSKDAKIFIGLPASPTSAGSGYVKVDRVKELVCKYRNQKNYGGISLWELTRGLEQNPDYPESYQVAVRQALDTPCKGDPPVVISTTSSAKPSTSASSTTSSAMPSSSTSTTSAEPSTTSAASSSSTPVVSSSTSAAPSTSTPVVSSTSAEPSSTSAAPSSSTSVVPSSSVEPSSTPAVSSSSIPVVSSTSAEPSSTPAASSSSTPIVSSTSAEPSSAVPSSAPAASSSSAPVESSSSVEPSSAPASSSTPVPSSSVAPSSVPASGSASPSSIPAASSSSTPVVSITSSPSQATPSSTDSVSLTTSTVYTTSVHTVTSCAPTVTNCPTGRVVTETIPLYTTVCPVSQTAKPTSTKPASEQLTTSTVYTTRTYTITSCAPTVTNCPHGSVTTEVVPLYTTICPVSNTKDIPGQTNGPQKPIPTTVAAPGSSGIETQARPATSSSKGSEVNPPAGGCTGVNCPGVAIPTNSWTGAPSNPSATMPVTAGVSALTVGFTGLAVLLAAQLMTF